MDGTQEIVFSSAQLFGFFMRGLLCAAMPFAGFVILRKKYGVGFFPMFVGLVTVMLILLPREVMRRMLLPGADTLTGKWLTVWFVGACFEELGRYVAMKHAMPNHDTLPDILCYGLGHGGAETLITARMQFAILYHAATRTGEHLEAYSQQGFLTAMEVICGQTVNLAFHMAMSVLIARAVHYPDCKKLIPIAIFIHVLADFTIFCFDPIADVMLTAVICIFVYLHGKRYPDGLI